MSLRLLQSKLYLKILSISYFVKNTNLLLSSDIVKIVIKSTYILNNIVLVSYPHIIKASLKSNIVVIWVDIWDSQSGQMLKCWSISALILEVTLLIFIAQIWTPVSLNVKIAGNKITLSLYVAHIGPSAKNAMDYTN